MTTLAINDPKFSITPTGIQFRQNLSFDEWDNLGQKLAPIGDVDESRARRPES